MKAHFELKSMIQSINGQDYKSYKSIEGEYLFNKYALLIDRVQETPLATPSSVRVRIPQDIACFPDNTYSSRSREIALRDFITRRFHEGITKFAKDREGSKKSSTILIDNPGQEILERTSAFIDKSFVEIRFTVDLPADKGKVAASKALDTLFEKLPQIIECSAVFENLDKYSLYKHIETSEDADFLRNELENIRLIAFVAEGSMLPRESDGSPLPLQSDSVVPFLSPDILKMDVELPNLGQITGLGIPRGVTLITGDEGQGKSTLLKAIEQGIYNHIPGDGREYVISNPNSVRISAEAGRNITSVEISAFIKNPSPKKNASLLSTENADSDISQVANLVEAVEVGADVLLIDEDTSSNNFILIQGPPSEENEVINPYFEKARGLFNEYMVSTILVISESAEFIDIADFVIQMSGYKAEDITLEAKEGPINNLVNSTIGPIVERIPLAESIETKIVGLNSIEQIVSQSQTNAIEDAIKYAKKYMDGKKSFRQVTSLVMLDIGRGGLDVLSPILVGNYSEFRKIELAAAINRLKTLKVENKD